MIDAIFYDSDTMRVLSTVEVQEIFAKKTKGRVLSVDPKFVEIKDGYIVKKYTQEELDQIRQAKEDAETDRFLEMLNAKTKERQNEFLSKEIDIDVMDFLKPTAPAPQKAQIPRRRKKRTVAYNLRAIMANIAKELARKQSVPNQKQSAKRTRSNKKTIEQRMAIAMIVLLLGASVAAGYGLRAADQKIEYNMSHNSVRQSTATLLDETPDKYSPHIVAKNTGHNHIEGIYWYEDDQIAEDLLALPDETFDANLYLVYALMGDNANNAYDNHFDNIISYVGSSATLEENPNAFLRCNGCSSLEEFLVKNGFVNEQGLPDVNLYMKHGRNATITSKNRLEKLADEYKTEYIESINKGGR